MTESFILFRQALHGFLLGELIQQQRFGDDVVLQRRQTDGLVRAMRVGLRILRTGDQHLRLREDALQFRNERDGATLALVDRSHTERFLHGVHGVLGGLSVRIHGPAHAVVELVDPHFGTERRMLHHELGQRLLGLFRALVRRGAQAQTERFQER